MLTFFHFRSDPAHESRRESAKDMLSGTLEHLFSRFFFFLGEVPLMIFFEILVEVGMLLE